MVQVRCPKCSSLVEGIEGQDAVCGTCGFRATLPKQPPASIAKPPAAAAAGIERPAKEPAPLVPAAGVPLTGNALLAVWGYILGLAGLATFFLADYGLPFAFGGAALILSLLAFQRDRKERRALLGLILGGVAVLAAIVWLVV